MGPVFLALGACFSFGISDYLQGVAARKSSALPVMMVSQAAGLAAIIMVAFAVGGVATPIDLIWGASGGVLLLTGIVLLIHAFMVGSMSVASPVIALVNIGTCVLYGGMTGEHFGSLSLTGLVLSTLAIFLVNRTGQGIAGLTRTALAASIASGLAFGGFNIVMSKVGPQAGLWPLLAGLIVRMALLVIIALVTRRAGTLLWRECRSVLSHAAPAGLLVTAGMALFLVGLQKGGGVAIMGTIASEAPLVTIFLAVLLVGERLNRVQSAGLFIGAVSLILMGL